MLSSSLPFNNCFVPTFTHEFPSPTYYAHMTFAVAPKWTLLQTSEPLFSVLCHSERLLNDDSTTQQKKRCAFFLTFSAPFYQQWTQLCTSCAHGVFGPWTVLDPDSQQLNAQLSYLHIFTPMCLIGFRNTKAKLCFSLGKSSICEFLTSLVLQHKLSHSVIFPIYFFKIYLISPSSSPPPTQWTFSIILQSDVLFGPVLKMFTEP